MFENIAGQVSPKTLKVIKITTVVVCVAAGAVVAAAIAYKMGLIGETTEVLEEVIETAAQATA